MKYWLKKGTTSLMLPVFVPDKTAPGSGNIGLNNTHFKISTRREGDAAETVNTVETITTLGTYQAPTSATHIRIREMDAVNAPGHYEMHVRNELLATGARWAKILLFDAGSNNIPAVNTEIQLTDLDPNSPPVTAAELAALINKGKVFVTTTIATLASQTSFTLTDGSPDNNAYNDRILIVVDQATATQVALGKVSTYVGGTRTVTLAADPAIFTMGVGDTVVILAQSPGGAIADSVLQAIANRVNNNNMNAVLGVPDVAGVTAAARRYTWNIEADFRVAGGDNYALSPFADGAPVRSPTTVTGLSVTLTRMSDAATATPAFTEIGSTRSYKANAGAFTIPSGDGVVIEATATINGETATGKRNMWNFAT